MGRVLKNRPFPGSKISALLIKLPLTSKPPASNTEPPIMRVAA